MSGSQDATCPPRDRLVDFLLGHLADAELALLEGHLSACGACGDTLRALNAEDTLVALARSARAEPSDEALVEGLIERMREMHSGADVSRWRDEPVRDERAEGIRNLLRPAEQADELGRLANYRVLGHLGTGGMGVVFEVEDEKLKRPVALKVLRPSLGAGARDRFLQEARAAAAIDHENVVTIYEVGEDEGLAYLAMQRLDGETLESLLKREGKLPADQCLRIGRQIALGLRASHAESLIHRDIKPANIWLETAHERVKLLDFGLARVLDDEPQLTESGMIAGTPAYMSPEQARGERVDARSDLFSLGCVLYRLATGRFPFEGTNALATLRAIERCEPKSPQELEPGMPKPLAELVMWLLRKDPDGRPQSADVVVDSLDAIDGGDWQSVAAASSPTRQPRPARARSMGRWFVGLAVVVLLGFSGYFAGPIVVSIAMNRGELVIETNDPDVKIEILADGEVCRIVDLRTEQAVDLTAGEYGIQVAGVAEGWSLSTDRFTLRRGGKAIVEVRHEPGKSESDGDDRSLSSDVLMYDGKTIEQWLAESSMERKPERLTDAVRAFAVLADEESAGEAAQAVFRWMRRYDTMSLDSSPRGKLIEASREFLWRMPVQPVVAAMLQEIRDGNDNSRGFITWMSNRPREYGLDTQQSEAIDREMQRRAGEILSAALDLVRDEANDSGNWAFHFVVNFCKNYEIRPAGIDGLIPQCQKELFSGDNSRVLSASRILVESVPDSAGLVDSLISVLSDANVDSRLAAVKHLGELGPRSAPAVPKLVELLSTCLAEDASPELYVPEGWLSMGGGMLGAGGVMLGTGVGMRAPDLRLEIVQTLGKIGPDAEAALPVLRDALAATEWAYHSEVREAIARIEGVARGTDEMDVGEGADGTSPRSSLLYGGKSLKQWLAESSMEREPKRLADAVQAFEVLVDEESAAEVAQAVFGWMQRHDVSTIRPGSRRELLDFTDSLEALLWQMPAQPVVEAMLTEITTGNAKSRRFVSSIAIPRRDPAHIPKHFETIVEEMKRRSGEIVSTVMELASEEPGDAGDWAQEFLIQFCGTYGVDAKEVEGLVLLCQEELSSGDRSRVLAASRVLVQSVPDSEGLADALISVLSEPNVGSRFWATQCLGDLGARAAPAVPMLVSLLRNYANDNTASFVSGDSWRVYEPTKLDLRIAIIRTLGKIGPDAKAALPLLRDERLLGHHKEVENAIPLIEDGAGDDEE